MDLKKNEKGPVKRRPELGLDKDKDTRDMGEFVVTE